MLLSHTWMLRMQASNRISTAHVSVRTRQVSQRRFIADIRGGGINVVSTKNRCMVRMRPAQTAIHRALVVEEWQWQVSDEIRTERTAGIDQNERPLKTEKCR
ncbi:hypothetical protein ES702_03420 [subsurface metagenome]